MAKFEFRLIEKNATWKAEIIRKVSARKTKVTKSKDGFATEKDADEWAQVELKALSSKVSERRRAVKSKKDVLKEVQKEKEKQNEIDKLKALDND